MKHLAILVLFQQKTVYILAGFRLAIIIALNQQTLNHLFNLIH